MFGKRVEAGINPGLLDRTLYDAGCRDMHAIRDRQMPADHGRTAHGTILAEYRATGHADASGHRRIFSDMAIVSDLYLVIELDAVFDNRIRQGAPIDSRIGTDLDIVADDNPAGLRNLDPDAIFVGKTETFATDYSQDGNRKIVGKEGDSFEITMTENVPINTLMLQENIAEGQRIEEFTVEASINGVWETIAEGTTVGYKRLVRFNDIVADKLRVTINRTRADFSILRTGLFYASHIIDENSQAQENLFTPKSCLVGDKNAAEAIDGNVSTAVHENGLVPVLIDLGEIKEIKGFCYTPVAEGNTEGTIFRYNLYHGNDGKSWQNIVRNAEFSNIKNNPIPQFVTLDKPLKAKYLKLEPIEEINGNKLTSIADFGVMIP